MSIGSFLSSNITTWRCSAPPRAVVEVLQSSPTLLASIIGGAGNAVENPPTLNRRLFVLFTGNPGLVHFYEDFVRILSDNHAMDVLVMGFAGHSLVSHNGGRLFSLQDQIDIADQFMRAVLDSPAAQRYHGNVFIGGHSIGGFVAVHMLARHRDSIRLCFGLCPVLTHMMESPNGRDMFFWGVPVLQWIMLFVGSLFAVLPFWIRRRFVASHAPMLRVGLQASIAQGVTRAGLMNPFFLTFDEYRCVTAPDTYLLRSVQEKLCLYYTPCDGWAPKKNAEEIRALLPRLRSFTMESDEGVPHAWCLQHSGIIIDRAIARFIGA